MISGILLIDKPEGISSFDVVRRVRRVFKERKIGHLGTLDPFATGLLPLCLGEATKLVPYLMPGAKTYRATLKLGEATDTQDLTGQVVSRSEAWPSPEQVYPAAAGFVGEIQQVPPMHSALHYQGQRLYKLARRGEQVELAPRTVTIYGLEVEEVELPRVTIKVKCSAGTYIRTLAADLGAALGCGAHLTALRRLEVGQFRVTDAVTLEALEKGNPEAGLARLIPLVDCLPGMRQVSVGPEEADKVRQGQALAWQDDDFPPDEPVRVMSAGELLALARMRRQAEQVILAPVRVFLSSQRSDISDQQKPKALTKIAAPTG
ncbi:MAG: tRNA pseudouridine(55) synthase TruB [Deltaproteobacteria bacterium]|nr:tRNA pseudouridine(55) synthase TruB [Deltaproteobacteria bacterium]